MIEVEEFYGLLNRQQINFFAGVPDSQLKEFCDYITLLHGVGKSHIIAPNEGSAVALVAGYHLSTGKIGLVYMQNSGLGNAINPLTSLTDTNVYNIPLILLIGWRGMPGVHDEPQHIKQGEITLDILEVLGINYCVLTPETEMAEIQKNFNEKFIPALRAGGSVAFVVAKGTFKPIKFEKTKNFLPLSREEAICIIAENMRENDVAVSTTGKASRELFEYRERIGQGHARDFLTVGSMGHASMIALAIAEQKEDRKIWCLDGDGAVLMHLGGLALIGSRNPGNFIHVVLNNGAHESVGGMPTVMRDIDLVKMAYACGYSYALKVSTSEELKKALVNLRREKGPILLEVDINLNSRKNLGRPTVSPIENKNAFMHFLI